MNTTCGYRVKHSPVFGVWNLEGNCWMLADNGYIFKTSDIDYAADTRRRFREEGDRVEVREIPIEHLW